MFALIRVLRGTTFLFVRTENVFQSFVCRVQRALTFVVARLWVCAILQQKCDSAILPIFGRIMQKRPLSRAVSFGKDGVSLLVFVAYLLAIIDYCIVVDILYVLVTWCLTANGSTAFPEPWCFRVTMSC